MSSSSYPSAGIAATYQQRRRELLRELLLDGARARLLDSRWEDVSMLAVATFAGVGRGALYKEFETRRNLIRALIRREAGRLSESWSEPLRAGAAQPARAFEETFERFLAASVENGLLVAVLRPGEAELHRLAASHKASVLTRLGSAMSEAWPLLGRSEAEDLSEWLFRFALSVVRAPATPSTARHVGELLGCYVQARLTEAAGHRLSAAGRSPRAGASARERLSAAAGSRSPGSRAESRSADRRSAPAP